MPSQETTSSEDTFLDRWGHWVLWMGPYILIVSLLAWTPHLSLLLIGIELVQFTVHTARHHPHHPLIHPPGVVWAAGMMTIGLGILQTQWTCFMALLVVCQVVFSSSVHRWFHREKIGEDGVSRGKLYIDLVGFPILSVVVIICMIMDESIPGFPLLRDFLL